MTDTPVQTHKPPRRTWLSYWWVPLTVVAVVLAVAAYVYPYQPVQLADLAPGVRESAGALDKSFGKPLSESLQYSARRTYSSPSGPMNVEIRVTLRPMADGLVQRQDDWYDLNGGTVVYQERYVLFRNLFAVHTRTREVAPVVRDLMGRTGWYNDSVQGIASAQEGGTPDMPGWKLRLLLDRQSDVDGKGLVQETKRYQRVIQCWRTGEVEATEVGAGFTGTLPKVTCSSKSSDQASERRSDYAWLPDHGIFLLLGYRQQSQSEQLEVKGSYVSFKVVP